MRAKPVYQAMGFGMLRMPVYPVRNELPALDGTHVHDATDSELTAYLLAAHGERVLREAVTISSPALGALLDRLANGERLRRGQLRKAAISVARYIVRAGTRSTPFGLFAGVAPVFFGEHASVRIRTAHVRHARADGAWLHGLLRHLGARVEILRVLDVVVNDQCVRKGGSFHVPLRTVGARRHASDRTGRAVVRAHPVVEAVVELARRPIGFAELLDHLLEDFPDLPLDRLERQLLGLVRCELLLTSLVPPLDCLDPLEHVARATEDVPDSPVAARLRDLADRLAGYHDGMPGEGFPEVLAAAKAVDPSYDPGGTAVQVDLRLDADVTLPPAVVDEAAAAVDLLWRLAPPESAQRSALRAYQARFVERYGPDALVPLVELLDPERGLGMPEWARQPAGDDDEGAGERDAILAELIRPAGRLAREAVLTDEIVDRLTRPSPVAAAPTTEVKFQLSACDTAAVDRGDFEVVVLGGSHQAGAHFGRMTHALPELTEQVRDALKTGVPAGCTPAQLRFQAVDGLAYSLGNTPRFTDWDVSVGEFRTTADQHIIRADELLVGVDEDGLRLVSSGAGGEVHLVNANMLIPQVAASPAGRLLREISLDNGRSWADWDWGAFGQVPRLPRVRYGRAVLAPERWHASSAMREAGRDRSRWKPAFDEWRKRHEVPATVQVGSRYDYQLTLDLDSPAHQGLLFEELVRQPWTRIEESLSVAYGATGWSDGYCAELVVPLETAVRPAPGRHPVVDAATRPQFPPLVGDWIDVRIPSSSPVQEEILTDRLPWLIDTLGEDLDRWFFVRHDGPGLSLRLSGARQRLLETVLPVVSTWTADLGRLGLAGDCALVPYRQEATRYGGAGVMADAEAVFHADSEAAVGQLRLARRKELPFDPQLVTALGLVATVRASRQLDWADWLVHRIPREFHREAFRSRRGELRELTGYDSQALADRCGGPELATAWRIREAALVRYANRLLSSGGTSGKHSDDAAHDAVMSLLRLHHNRAVGIDEQSEGATFALARGFAELTVNTALHNRG